MTTKTKILLELIDERIVDLELRAGDSNFMLTFREAARARIDELQWVKRQMGVNKGVRPEVRPEICKDCPTWEECQGSNQEDCERRVKRQMEVNDEVER